MRYIKTLLVSTLLLTSLTAGAAELINKEKEQHLQKIGVVSVTAVRGSMDDAVRQLKKEAENKGADYISITSLGTSGDSSLYHGTAEIFK
ncbi:DUF1471 domain-containing protein [Enterobacter sp. E105B]|uniref:DUF1471 domain-containing protein n=1 Tax=Enterobacter sp. E105B TaxID=3047465 RepID=UPI0025A18D0A|nr:DUF1471 domain-containing protein [Enterobacter sp. E105B]